MSILSFTWEHSSQRDTYHNYMLLLNPQKELLGHAGKRKCKYWDKNEYFRRRRGGGTLFNINFRSERRTVNAQDEWRRLQRHRRHRHNYLLREWHFPTTTRGQQSKVQRGLGMKTFTRAEIYSTPTLNLHMRLLEENAEMATGFDVKLTNCCACGV